MNFEVGDRVRVFGWVESSPKPFDPKANNKATVTCIYSDNGIEVMFDDPAKNKSAEGHTITYSVHPKQCRRLKKIIRLKRNLWMAPHKEKGKMPHIFYRKPEIKTDADGGLFVRNQSIVDPLDPVGWKPVTEIIEFIEVRKKK